MNTGYVLRINWYL